MPRPATPRPQSEPAGDEAAGGLKMLQAMKPSIRSSLWIRGIPQRKFRRAIRAIRLRTLREILGRPPRQRPRDRYFHIADQPLRRQRKTVSGWTMTRLLRQSDHRA